MRLLACLACLLPTCVWADPIAITILNQTTEASVQAGSYAGGISGPSCANNDAMSASCTSQVTFQGLFVEGAATANIGSGQLSVSAGASPEPLGFGAASARLNQNVLISGGNGTGYLNVAFNFIALPQTAYVNVNINGQIVQPPIFETMWAVIPFTFGQAFGYDLSLSTSAESGGEGFGIGNGTLTTLGARVYTSQPSACPGSNYGFCDDPNFTDVTADISRVTSGSGSGISDVPEPGTALMALLALGALGARRRSRRAGVRRQVSLSKS